MVLQGLLELLARTELLGPRGPRERQALLEPRERQALLGRLDTVEPRALLDLLGILVQLDLLEMQGLKESRV
jgi:hypothetical protein